MSVAHLIGSKPALSGGREIGRESHLPQKWREGGRKAATLGERRRGEQKRESRGKIGKDRGRERGRQGEGGREGGREHETKKEEVGR